MAARPAQEDPENEDGGTSRKGLSLRLKFSLVLILTIAILTVGAGAAFYRIGVRQIDEEVDRRGATLVTTLAHLGSAHWNGILASGKSTEHLQDYLKLAATEHEIFDLIFFEAQARPLMAARASDEITFQGGTKGSYAGDKSIQVLRNRTMLLKNSPPTAVRIFQMPVRVTSTETKVQTPKGDLPPVVSVMLVLNAEAIEKVRHDLRNSVIVTTILAVGLGGAVAFFLASIVTGPLLMLIKDIRIVSSGNLDHKTRVHSSDEIGELATTFNHMTVMMRVAREVDMERQGIEHDLNLARQIQSNLLPKKIPKLRGVDLQAFYRSAKEVGGDYYDLIPLTSQHLGIAVGDVSGKGVQGSLVMAMTRSILRAMSPGVTSAAKTLTRVNHILAKDLKTGSFVTLIYLVLDVVGRTITVGRAGHNPLLVYHGERKTAEFLNPPGIALGFDAGPIFDRVIKETSFPLVKGDVVVAYTDGVVESMNEAREQYGDDRFRDVVAANAHRTSDEIVKALVAELDRHQGSAPQHDDITIVVLKVL